jgi:enoyl-CoA hydratase
LHATAEDPVTDYRTIKIEHEGPLSWLVLNRPDHANALSPELMEEFSDALETLVDEGGPVIGIRGEGLGFCGGFDLNQVTKVKVAADPVGDRDRLQRNLNRLQAIWDHPKPVIAAVHGYCVAGGTLVCVFTDLTIVAEDAHIGAPPKLPVGGGFVAPHWAPLVGPKRAKEMAFVPGNHIDGRTAVEWGWANHAVPAARLLEAVRGLAERIAKTHPDLLRIKKLSINRAMEAMGTRQATAAATEMDALAHLTPSVLELRDRIRADGVTKELIAAYESPPTTPLLPSRDQTS